ncbi:hypothetical protein [Streptomyces sp. NPDC060187]|uniref:hypothetical protein n=1 Tax=Streptomyces sp. NPDC060187 TaxID=3347067 RepID=UPI00365A3A76
MADLGPVVYYNFREQPFCQACANCGCAENPCVRTGINDPAVSSEAAAAPIAPDGGPTVAEAAQADRRWSLEKVDE